jgi:hypothetical protein
MRGTQPVGDRVVADRAADHPVTIHRQYQATVHLVEAPADTELAAMVLLAVDPLAADLRAEAIPEVDRVAVVRVATAPDDIFLLTNTARATRDTKFLAIPLAAAINRCSVGKPSLRIALARRSKALRLQKFN